MMAEAKHVFLGCAEVTFTGSSCVVSLKEEGVDVLAFGAKEGEELVRATIEMRS